MFEEQGSLYTNFNLCNNQTVQTPALPTLLPRKKLMAEKNNSGRWKELEHKKFLEAIIMNGNDWKAVHKYIKSRSSTQARSHAQKFLLKLRKKLKIVPSFDAMSQSMKLSSESIHKIIREIVETSSMRGNQVDKDKLVKLIMGFANLLIGKSKVVFEGNNMYSNTSYNQDKVFFIEKVKKNKTATATATATIDSTFLIEKTKKVEQQTNNIQITSQSDLWKLLLAQNQPQDPSNPNKNVINIISINISNKNGEQIPLTLMPMNLNNKVQNVQQNQI